MKEKASWVGTQAGVRLSMLRDWEDARSKCVTGGSRSINMDRRQR